MEDQDRMTSPRKAAPLAKPPERRRQKDRNAETRLKLLNSAARTIFELGYGRASIGEIVKRAGLTKGAHLHHFQTKEHLMRATIEHLFAEVRNRQERVVGHGAVSVEVIEEDLEAAAAAAFDWRFISLLELWMASRTEESLLEAFTENEARNAAARRQATRNVVGDYVMDHSHLAEVIGGFNFLLRGLFLQRILAGNWRKNPTWLYWRHEIARQIAAVVANPAPSAAKVQPKGRSSSGQSGLGTKR
jgi:AcrR family transcriptional regulator